MQRGPGVVVVVVVGCGDVEGNVAAALVDAEVVVAVIAAVVAAVVGVVVVAVVVVTAAVVAVGIVVVTRHSHFRDKNYMTFVRKNGCGALK